MFETERIFALTFVEKGGDIAKVHTHVDGFNLLEQIALLELYKNNLIEELKKSSEKEKNEG